MDQKTKDLLGLKLSTVRSHISEKCYERCMYKTFLWYIFDLCWYAGSIALILLSNNIWLQLLGGLLAGLATSALFVWGHDAAHGALFKNKHISEVLGSIAMLPSFNIYRLWCYGHNRVHHGFTSMTEVDWIWKPLSPEQYFQKSKLEKCVYKLERSLFTCAIHYFLKVWWQKMIRFKLPKPRLDFTIIKIFTLIFALSYLFITYYATGQLWATFCAVVLPFIVFNYVIALFVYLHHTHPTIPYFKTRDEWSFSVGGIQCSTIIRMTKLGEMLTHNIMIHVPHHVDFRIPFYKLSDAYQDLRKEYKEYITEYQFSWRAVSNIFKSCKLFDYESKTWYSFDNAPRQ